MNDAPVMRAVPVDFLHGAEIIGVGVALFVMLEIEKVVVRRVAGRSPQVNAAIIGARPAS